MLRLDLGSGGARIEGYIPIDASLGHDVRSLPYDEGSCDQIRASHILEHLPWCETRDTLRHWVSRLNDGGVLRVAVPSLDWIMEQYRTGAVDPTRLEMYLMGGQVDALDEHRAVFTRQKLTALMESVGLSDIQEWHDGSGDCASLPVSLNLQGTRRITAPPPLLPRADLLAVMSIPRLVFADNVFCAIGAVSTLGIEITRSGGAFWDAAMTRLFERAQARVGTKWILAIDYDTVFTPADIVELLRIAEAQELDALAALQVGRERDSVLLSIEGCGRITRAMMQTDALPVSTAHFGLTLVRVAALERVQRPWFVGTPSPDGGWGAGRIDADIHFWRQAARAGLRVAVAPRVRVGHLQQVITWPDQHLHTRHQYASAYAAHGRPWYADA